MNNQSGMVINLFQVRTATGSVGGLCLSGTPAAYCLSAVLLGGQTYALRRKPSNIGWRFVSPQATLIIDGDFAAFVADDLNHLRGCHVAPD